MTVARIVVAARTAERYVPDTVRGWHIGTSGLRRALPRRPRAAHPHKERANANPGPVSPLPRSR
jgi:hypothetical protein